MRIIKVTILLMKMGCMYKVNHCTDGGICDDDDYYNMMMLRITPGSTLVTFTPVPVNSFLRHSLAPVSRNQGRHPNKNVIKLWTD